jgi:hypothetical protein
MPRAAMQGRTDRDPVRVRYFVEVQAGHVVIGSGTHASPRSRSTYLTIRKDELAALRYASGFLEGTNLVCENACIHFDTLILHMIIHLS